MKIEALFPEVCSLFGDGKNIKYLELMLPEAEFIKTPLTGEPYLAPDVDLVLIGSMTERTQRMVLEKLIPCKEKLLALVDSGVPILATGSAADIFCREIHYVTEKIDAEGLGIFDLEVRTDLFKRYNGKVLGRSGDLTLTGFKSQFSFFYGDNSAFPFMECERGIGINPQSRLEGMRRNNLICTQLLGPLLPSNPLFAEYLVSLTGRAAEAPFKKAAMAAYEQRLREFRDPKTEF